MEIPLFDLKIKDGTILKKCAILKMGEDGSPVPIETPSEASQFLMTYQWSNYWNKLHFQNSSLRGHVHGDCLSDYEYVGLLEL